MLRTHAGSRVSSMMLVLGACATLLVLVSATSVPAKIIWFEGGAAFAPYTEPYVNAAHGGRMLMVNEVLSSDVRIVRNGTLCEVRPAMAPYTERTELPAGYEQRLHY